MRSRQFVSLTEADEDLTLHERLYRRIRYLILSGALQDGVRLASSRELAGTLDVSRNSVINALDRLIADGWLTAKPNSGVYVSYCGGRRLSSGAPLPVTLNPGPPLKLGWPTDVFPVDIWRKLQTRNWRKAAAVILRQPDCFGLEPLRSAIAVDLAISRGLSCVPEQVIVTTSVLAGMDIAIRVLGLVGVDAWVEDPWGGCPSAARSSAARSTSFRCRWMKTEFRVKDAKRRAPQARLALVGPACQAPTGATMRGDRRLELLNWASTNSNWLFEDDFNWNGDGISRKIAPLAGTGSENVIYFNSFSHITFPGLRIAYMVIPQSAIDRFRTIQWEEPDVNGPNQLILTDFIEGGYLSAHQRLLDEYNMERRTVLSRCVNDHLKDWTRATNESGGYFICRLRRTTESQMIAVANEAGIVVGGLSQFRFLADDDNAVVLGFSMHKSKDIEAAVRQLERAMRSGKG